MSAAYWIWVDKSLWERGLGQIEGIVFTGETQNWDGDVLIAKVIDENAPEDLEDSVVDLIIQSKQAIVLERKRIYPGYGDLLHEAYIAGKQRGKYESKDKYPFVPPEFSDWMAMRDAPMPKFPPR